MRGAPEDPALLAELAAWLSQDRKNAEAWDAAQRVWVLAGRVGPARRDSVAVSRLKGRGRRRAYAAACGVAAAIALFVVVFPAVELRLRADHLSLVGETRAVALADGSQVELDSGSAIAVTYTENRREVRLLAGQAFFDVMADRARPFSVNANGVGITVAGTAFDVRMTPEHVTVTVAHGTVRVAPPSGVQRAETVLAPGQRLRIGADGSAELTQVAERSIAPWRRGKLLAESATVAELVTVLRRYSAGTIVITDEVLAAQHVTGVFDLTDPVRALRAVVEPHAGRVREITPWLLVVSGS